MSDYDPRGQVFEFIFKDRLTAEELEGIRLIAASGAILHPAVYRRIHEILDGSSPAN